MVVRFSSVHLICPWKLYTPIEIAKTRKSDFRFWCMLLFSDWFVLHEQMCTVKFDMWYSADVRRYWKFCGFFSLLFRQQIKRWWWPARISLPHWHFYSNIKFNNNNNEKYPCTNSTATTWFRMHTYWYAALKLSEWKASRKFHSKTTVPYKYAEHMYKWVSEWVTMWLWVSVDSWLTHTHAHTRVHTMDLKIARTHWHRV